MAEANMTPKELYLEENVKKLKQLPNDLVRLSASFQHLDKQFEENLITADNCFKAFENQSYIHDTETEAWTSKDDLCLKNLKSMRMHEQKMMSFQDEKMALIEQNVHSLESYISKITRDLHEFQKILQPNQIALPFPKKN